MRRRLIQVALLLVLGAIVNVAVAWGCARWSHVRRGWSVNQGDGQRSVSGFGVTKRIEISSDPTIGRITTVVEHEVGWPCRVAKLNVRRPFATWLDSFSADPSVVVIWPGFAINTVFYAVVLWLLFALGGTPFALRRRRRIKRGLCPKCAYDLRNRPLDSTSCPECGTVMTPRRGEGM